MSFVNLILLVLSLITLIPSLVLLVESLAAGSRPAPQAVVDRPKLAVLVPAHDEEADIGTTLAALSSELAPGDRLLVVADNCSDRTAAVAAAAGAEVIERLDPEHQGKGYALAFGVAHLALRPPEAVIVVDADCRVSPGALGILARRALDSGRPVQAEYLLMPPDHPDTRTVLSALAFLVRNRVRPRGLHRLGLPCQLTGSGMAFPWAVLASAPALGDNLVEDSVLGIALAEAGTPPLLCPEAAVLSVLPEPGGAQLGQRRRWEHGQLAALISHGPRLFAAGLRRARLDLSLMALDLMVPPLSLLVLALGGSVALTAAAALFGAGRVPLYLSLFASAAVVLAVTSAWLRFARRLLPARALLSVPLYVAWKIPLYLGFALRGRHKHWERTTRPSETHETRAA